jgi:hypothetical protein
MNNFENKTLLVAGDSWTYGSEIKDPELGTSVFDWDKENDNYRIPRIWPTKLANIYGINNVVNLSFPAASNDRIVRHVVGWLTQTYLEPKKDTKDLFVIIGFTSPERKDFYYKNNKRGNWITLWPMWKHDHQRPEINEFSELYTSYFYNQEESTHRYIHQLFYLQTLFHHYNINYIFFQAFYQRKDMMIYNWVDNPYIRNYNGQPDELIWNMIDPIRFMHKNDNIHSFHNYIVNKDQDKEKRNAIQGMHPSELGHTWWAEHIAEYVKENNLW